MIRRFIVLIILIIGLLGAQVLMTHGKSVFRYLKSPQVKWENNRLIGTLENVPLNELLTELAFWEGFELVMIGDLSHNISLSLDHLTIEETIKKIRRQTNVNYIIIFDEEKSSEPENRFLIEKLLVFQKENGGKRAISYHSKNQDQKQQVTQKRLPDQKKRSPSSQPEPPSPYQDRPGRGDGPSEPSGPEPDRAEVGQDKASPGKPQVKFEGDVNDLKTFVETLSSEERISSKEYEMILEKMKNKSVKP